MIRQPKQKVRTAIFPVAGMGTRFLPATKATPKELLPVLDTPLIQYAINEARDAGIERLVFVTHPDKAAIERHVMEDVALTKKLRAKGKIALADELQQAALSPVEDDAVFCMQLDPLGLGHAVLQAAPHVLDGPVAILLPDDLILGTPCLTEMVEAYAACEEGHMVATMRVPLEDTQKYGILEVSAREGQTLRATGMVEKPSPDAAPSREAVVGRYVLDPAVFEALKTQTPGAGGEIQLTDAISRGAETLGLAGFQFSGTRFDCGSKAGMLRATLHLAASDPELAGVLGEMAPAAIAAE
ncbi:MAG: UTP--glucose-1-phosphate uridylyltransferase [Pseudomonadota bacterium]